MLSGSIKSFVEELPSNVASRPIADDGSTLSHRHAEIHWSLAQKRRLSTTSFDLDQLAAVASKISPITMREEDRKDVDIDEVLIWNNISSIRLQQSLAYKLEIEQHLSILLFANNQEILPTMRCKLINWLFEVALHFRLHRETLYLAIHYIDCYLSGRSGVGKGKLQLIGISALFIASKLEEIYPPRLKEFSELTEHTFGGEEIMQMELDLMISLNWRLNRVTLHYWLNSYIEIGKFNHDIFFDWNDLMGKCFSLTDLALHTPQSLNFKYSIIAASCLLLHLSDPKIVHVISGYRENDLIDCVNWLRNLLMTFSEGILFHEPNCEVDGETHDATIDRNSLITQRLVTIMRSKYSY